MGIRDKMKALAGAIDSMRPKKEYLHFRTVGSKASRRVMAKDLDGERFSEKIMMCSNNYLALTDHPKVVAAAHRALDEWGAGAGGPCTIQGWTTLLQDFERDLAAFKGCEAAIVSPSGYSANVGTLTALLGPGDAFICDELDHASLIDGGRYSGADFYAYKHNDMQDLARVLADLDGVRCTKLVAVCGVFSMDGDTARLEEIVPLARRHDALVMVDDAHGTGVIGATGRGTAEHRGVTGQVDIVMGTFSKAFGGYGGFVAGSRELVEFLRHFARATMFSAAIAPMNVAALHAALDVMKTEPDRLARLRASSAWMKSELKKYGFTLGPSETAIIPVMIGDPDRCRAMVRDAYDAGLFLSMIEYPAVPAGTERIRLALMCTHTEADLAEALRILVDTGRRHRVIA